MLFDSRLSVAASFGNALCIDEAIFMLHETNKTRPCPAAGSFFDTCIRAAATSQCRLHESVSVLAAGDRQDQMVPSWSL